MSSQISEEDSTFKDPEMGYERSDIATTQSLVQINYKFHDKLRPADVTLITIPRELFEGPAQACLPVILQDLREEFSYMDASARQLELWVPNYPLQIKDTTSNKWNDSVALERDFKKILRPQSLSRQIIHKDDDLVHLVVTVKGQWAGNAVFPLFVKIFAGSVCGVGLFTLVYVAVYIWQN